MEEKTDNYQYRFIERIKQGLPKGYSLVNDLADLLKLSTDSAYRRIRCETSFTLDEIVLICKQYRISFDSFYGSECNSISFNYKVVPSSIDGFRSYLGSMLENLKKHSTLPIEIIYAAEDIPIFHSFRFPEFARFKIFYWLKSVLNVPEIESLKYDPKLVPDDIIETGKQMLELYNKIHSSEIWSDRTINSILAQIEYYHEAGFFKNVTVAINLCDSLYELLNEIQRLAERSTKAKVAGYENNFMLYNSDVEMGNNYILVSNKDAKTLYIRHHTFNNMITTHDGICCETEGWLKGLMQKSTLISGVSEKMRNRFFEKNRKRIEELRKKLS